ncbi:MAG: terminase TerL endonuclease subunit [Clostridium sp.]|uniref:terminase large subunit n=1 Tax=Clostridium sp. TaxID=1506 RepID=UPI003025386B
MDRVTKYAIDVLDGKEIAGEYVKLACKRHLDDLEKSKLAPYKYEFNIEKSLRIIDYAETLYIAEGEEKLQLELYSFQDFILGSLNGWVTKGTGYRRFRTSYIQLGRQNGKSFLNGILGTFYGNFDGYNYGQIYCTATKHAQAMIVFMEMVKFINSDEDLKELFKVQEYKSTIICNITNSLITALGRDTKSIDGFRPLLGIVDEYHAHKDNQMYKLLEGGIKKMKQALISVITTAGFDLNTPCFELYEYCCNLLKGVFTNESQFVYIAKMDEKDDIWNPENWIKANPTLAFDKLALENLIPVGDTARDMGGETLRDFITKQLNIWIQATDNVYIKDILAWKNLASEMSLEDMRGKECYVGLDLSSGGDLTSLGLVFPFYNDEGFKKYFLHSHSFMPSKRLAEHIKTDKAPYDMWVMEGLITLTETLGGIKTDYKYIIAYLKEIVKKYDLKVRMICYDPHNASAFLNDLEETGWDSLLITQSCKYLNDATVDFKLEVESSNIIYNKDEGKVLTWSLANAKVVHNSFKEQKIDKDLAQKRIDCVDAIIDAWTEAMKGNPIKKSIYEERGIRTI